MNYILKSVSVKGALFVLLFTCTLTSCMTQKNDAKNGILMGTTGVFLGNCMPSPGAEPCKPTPQSVTLLITKPTESYDASLLIDSLTSMKDGSYQISLVSGDYSLFLKDGESIVCRQMRCPNTCVCMPFSISTDSTTVLNPNLDRASW